MTTLVLHDTPTALNLHGVNLHDSDRVLINSSAGKDSLALLALVVAIADAQGYDRGRIIVVHADLGRVEHDGTRELAAAQAALFGLRFEVVARDEDLLDQVATRRRTLLAQAAQLDTDADALVAAGFVHFALLARGDAEAKRSTSPWPSSAARFCTSDQKTSQVAKLMTRLAAEWRAAGNITPIRILNTLGIRAAESPARALKVPYGPDKASNSRRTVTRWLPIFTWTDEQVWSAIRASGLPYHPAYDAGMPRLSCVFCVLAGERQLTIAARLRPDLAADYAAVETAVGFAFKRGLSVATLIERAA